MRVLKVRLLINVYGSDGERLHQGLSPEISVIHMTPGALLNEVIYRMTTRKEIIWKSFETSDKNAACWTHLVNEEGDAHNFIQCLRDCVRCPSGGAGRIEIQNIIVIEDN